MYNLATVLEEHSTLLVHLNHGLNNNDLKEGMEQLEKEYLDASKQNVSFKFI